MPKAIEIKSLLQNQALVFVGVAAAVFVLLALWETRAWALAFGLPSNDAASRLAFVARWLLLPAACLLVGVGMVANRRFLSADAMEGTRTPTSNSLEINLRYNQNTLEQLALAAVAWLNLGLTLQRDQISIIPVLAITFTVGRALFWIGYLFAPWARAFGFGLTFYPTAVAYVWFAFSALR